MQLDCPRCQAGIPFTERRPLFCPFCGQALSDPSATLDFDPEGTTVFPGEQASTPDAYPEVLGGYRLLKRLGQGAMGAVYEAEETASSRHVALKLIASTFGTSAETV